MPAPAPPRRTPALARRSEVLVETMLREAGVIRTRTLEELFDVATRAGAPAGTGRQPRGDRHQRRRAGHPGGRRLRGARPARAGARRGDAARRCARSCRRAASVEQPRRHDCVGDAGAVSARARGRRGRSRGRQRHGDLHSAAGHRAGSGRGRDPRAPRPGSSKPMLATFLGTQGSGPQLAPVPSFAFPEAAADGAGARHALRRVAATSRSQTAEPLPRGDARSRCVPSSTASRHAGRSLADAGTSASRCSTAAGAAGAALAHRADRRRGGGRGRARSGFPVVLKAIGKDIVHKSDVGGVRLSLASEQAVRDAFAAPDGDARRAARRRARAADGLGRRRDGGRRRQRCRPSGPS